VVLVTSSGVRNENSQGSGFVVEFDDSEDDVDEMDRCYILTSAHVAPPGWKVSVTFPGDPDKQYPATVVGRKLNSDLALLSVESSVDDDDDEYPFPPPLTLSSDDISTSTTASSSSKSAEIGSPLYAFGYPMGLEGPTMTSGILSATTKGINYMDAPTGEEPSEISKSRPFEKTSFVITDAAMAGGMSGGPLVDYDGVVLGVNALVRPDLRALGNYAVSSIECESFLEKLEAQVATESSSGKATDDNSRSERRKKRKEGQRSSSSSDDDTTSSSDGVPAEGVAGYRVMLYGYSTSKAEATTILKRTAGLDELRAENAMRSAYSFGAGVVDEFYVSESGDRKRAETAARKKADDLLDKLKKEGMMVEVEPLTLLP
jgi:S1-C subfamily serine protease